MKYMLFRLADKTKLQQPAYASEVRAAIQRDLDSLQKWTNRNFMKFKNHM